MRTVAFRQLHRLECMLQRLRAETRSEIQEAIGLMATLVLAFSIFEKQWVIAALAALTVATSWWFARAYGKLVKDFDQLVRSDDEAIEAAKGFEQP